MLNWKDDERYEYDAYGKVTIMTDAGTGTWFDGDETYASASAKGNPYTFTGRRLDSLDYDGSSEYQLKPMHYRHRTYDPEHDKKQSVSKRHLKYSWNGILITRIIEIMILTIKYIQWESRKRKQGLDEIQIKQLLI